VRALFAHLGVGYDLVESAPGTTPPELTRWSPALRAPFLVQEGTGVGESRVMLELLAETHAFARAYPSHPLDRALHREAMAIVDEKLAPQLVHDRPLRSAHLTEYLDRLTHVARTTPAAPCLLAFHVAPVWLRFQWWRPRGQITEAIRGRPTLVDWLDAIAALPAVASTSPTREDCIEDFNAVCALAAPA